MLGVLGVSAFLIVLGLSLVITRIATVALTLTGLSQETAQFQARSAFTGTGFTTKEAEGVVKHPVRRKIIMILMILRSAGLISIIISLILTFGVNNTEKPIFYLFSLMIGVLIFWLFAQSKNCEKYMNLVIKKALQKYTKIQTCDYISLLNLSGDFDVSEMLVKDEDWLVDKRLSELNLMAEGIMILGITRKDGDYVGVPKGNSKIYKGDTLILYGYDESLDELNQRHSDSSGDQAHEDAVSEHNRKMEKQDNEEKEREEKEKEKVSLNYGEE